jgi:predicted nucleic acid-binding protein
MTDETPTLILDACTVINIAATGRLPEILAAAARPVVVCDTVARETLYLRRGGTGEDASERDPIDVTPWVDAGHLAIIHAETDHELATFVDLAVSLDDGEAMTIALAVHRSLVVVTGDRKAARIAAALVPVESSLALVKAWCERDRLDPQTVSAILGAIRERARYIPHNQHPLRSWWELHAEGQPSQ